jgi:hypothetical protein
MSLAGTGGISSRDKDPLGLSPEWSRKILGEEDLRKPLGSRFTASRRGKAAETWGGASRRGKIYGEVEELVEVIRGGGDSGS